MTVDFSNFSPAAKPADLLREPIEEFLSRPRKELRSEVVKVGFSLYTQSDEVENNDLKIICDILEWIHSGSLIVDDIQDNSEERRGKKCLHKIYGVPSALNAANWMYFEAINKFNHLKLEEKLKLSMINLTLQTMAKAHKGQAIDLMINVKNTARDEIYSLGCLSHELKTGALFSLALQLGALLADENSDLKLLDKLGCEIGCSLQRFDDLSNFNLNGSSPKFLEDLILGRLSWPLMYLAKFRSEFEFNSFIEAIESLPDKEKLKHFLYHNDFRDDALLMAKDRHQQISPYLTILENKQLNFSGIQELKNIMQKVSYAYV